MARDATVYANPPGSRMIMNKSYHRIRRLRPLCAAALLLCGMPAAVGQENPRNLALSAHASAFESYEDMTPDLARDGKTGTRWSGIPGHNSGGWYALDWDQPVRIAQVVVLQFDRFVNEMDLQVWDQPGGAWVTLRHFGRPEEKLPRTVECRFEPRSSSKLRLANITGGPSFTEVEVFERPFAPTPELSLASDANGNFIGMVADGWGSAPLAGVEVSLSGQAGAGPWQAVARSDSNGLFFPPMPVGMTGDVSVMARPPQQDAWPVASAHFPATGFQYGLTPRNLHREETSLDGLWRFATDPPAGFQETGFDDSHWAEIKVPAHFEMEGFHSADGVAGYRKRFRPPGGKGRLKLRFEGVYSGAEVWVNGHKAAYHEGGALPFEVDVAGLVHSGENTLAVRVTEHTAVSDNLDHMSLYADFPLGGIMRPVRLFRVPERHIGGLQVSTAFDAEYRNAVLTARVAVLNESSRPLENGGLGLGLIDSHGVVVPVEAEPHPVRVEPWGRAETTFSIPVAAPRKWEAEHPNLYTLEVTLKEGKRVLEQSAQRIGFRQTEIRDRQLLINGCPIKIRGTCHHDQDPLLGRAVTADLERRDALLIKEANLNSIRTSHYPPLPALLDLADELGIYVEDEGSFCWADNTDDVRLAPRIIQLNAELLARDRNHPSVFIWSVCNESHWGFGLLRANDWMHRSDPTRPHAGSWSDAGDIDVAHNPISMQDIARVQTGAKPVIWDEAWCIFQGIFGDAGELWVDPGIRDYFAQPLPAIFAKMMQTTNIIGSQIWAWSDDIFCVPRRGVEFGRRANPADFVQGEYLLPNRGLVGDAPWGVVDGWRRRKPEFWITKKLQSPVKIKEGPLALPGAGQPIRVRVENQYDFTDLSDLATRWQMGGEQGQVRVSVPPHATGDFEIQTKASPHEGDTLALEFVDSHGAEVDAYRLPLGRPATPVAPVSALEAAPLRISHQTYLQGDTTVVSGKDFELAFDASLSDGAYSGPATGGLRRGLVLGKLVLTALPHLHVLAGGRPDSPLPNLRSWRISQLDIKPEGANVRVRMAGHYDQFEGNYDLLITPEGQLTIHSSFKYTGDPLLAREIGLAFCVPGDCDLLQWQRQGEWSVYPSGHIGRNLGETRAFARHGSRLPPTWPCEQDNSPLGCNDFRGTKRNIDWAAISGADGAGVCVLSDGSQHFRATVQFDRIVCHVNDWYGGSYMTAGEWTVNYGRGRPLESGQTLESTIRLQLGRMRKSVL